jgi:hypothetical protein
MIIVKIIININIIEWLIISEIKINGIIFCAEKKIMITIQSIYIEIIGNQKCNGDNPNLSISFKIIIIFIREE